MKKKLTFIFIIMLINCISVSFVKADIDPEINYMFPIENTLNQKPNEEAINYIYNTLIDEYNGKDYLIKYQPFYTNIIYVYFFEKNDSDYLSVYGNNIPQLTYYAKSEYTLCSISNNSEHNLNCNNYESSETNHLDLLRTRYPGDGNSYNSYAYYDSNFDIVSQNDFTMTSFYSDNIIIENGEDLPKLKDLYEFSSWSDYLSKFVGNYTTVNLDDYEYVLLSLKDYSQEKPFSTNLQVKGQVGITPIYNYGQTSKDEITGAKVQDGCNISYSNFTKYPFYILQSDLQNNAVYAVKKCSNGSSFKFDNTIFDITYITTSNLDNPTVTINGNTYQTILYDDLPSSATENGTTYPGTSCQLGDLGCTAENDPNATGFDNIIDNILDFGGTIWSSVVNFMLLVTKLITVLPPDFQQVILICFTFGLIVGCIKIFIK